MGANSNIEWCDDTWNFVRGCTKVSPGCLNCYAEDLCVRRGLAEWGDKPRTIASEQIWRDPLRWNKHIPMRCPDCGHKTKFFIAAKCPMCGSTHIREERSRVFVGSLMDVWDPAIPDAVLARAFSVMFRCQNLNFLLLSKRVELAMDRIEAACRHIQMSEGTDEAQGFEDARLLLWLTAWLDGEPPNNIWIGWSAENQKAMDDRTPHGLAIPAPVHFVSMEPLLGAMDITNRGIKNGYSVPTARHDGIPCEFTDPGPNYIGVDWVIVGGESGKKRRPMELDWMGGIIDQCKAAGVPEFVKQDTAFKPGQQGRIPDAWWALKQFPEVR